MPGDDVLLQGLKALRRAAPRISVNEMMVFAAVCEQEGLTVQALAQRTGLAQSTTSRSLRALGSQAGAAAKGGADLVEAFLNPADGRSRLVRLTERGRSLRERLNGLTRAA